MVNSEILLDRAIKIIDEASIDSRYWDVGGGTVLSTIYNHRLSKDIDVFINDVQLLETVSPKFNEPDDLLNYAEGNGIYYSLTFPEGKVDFIASPQLTKFKSMNTNLFNHDNVMIEDPIEIVTKKFYFRGNQLNARDIFDLSMVFNSNRKIDLIAVALEFKQQFKIFQDKFIQKYNNNELNLYSSEQNHMLLDGGKKIAGKELEICRNFIDIVERFQQILDYNNQNIHDSNKQIYYQTANDILSKNFDIQNLNDNIIKILSGKYSNLKLKAIMQQSPLKIENINKLLKYNNLSR